MVSDSIIDLNDQNIGWDMSARKGSDSSEAIDRIQEEVNDLRSALESMSLKVHIMEGKHGSLRSVGLGDFLCAIRIRLGKAFKRDVQNHVEDEKSPPPIPRKKQRSDIIYRLLRRIVLLVLVVLASLSLHMIVWSAFRHKASTKGKFSRTAFCAPILPGTKLGNDPFHHEAPYAVPHPFKEQAFYIFCGNMTRMRIKWYGSQYGKIEIIDVNAKSNAKPKLWAEDIKSGVISEDTLEITSRFSEERHITILPWIN